MVCRRPLRLPRSYHHYYRRQPVPPEDLIKWTCCLSSAGRKLDYYSPLIMRWPCVGFCFLAACRSSNSRCLWSATVLIIISSCTTSRQHVFGQTLQPATTIATAVYTSIVIAFARGPLIVLWEVRSFAQTPTFPGGNFIARTLVSIWARR